MRDQRVSRAVLGAAAFAIGLGLLAAPPAAAQFQPPPNAVFGAIGAALIVWPANDPELHDHDWITQKSNHYITVSRLRDDGGAETWSWNWHNTNTYNGLIPPGGGSDWSSHPYVDEDPVSQELLGLEYDSQIKEQDGHWHQYGRYYVNAWTVFTCRSWLGWQQLDMVPAPFEYKWKMGGGS